MLTFDAAAHAYAWNRKSVPSVTQIIRSALPDPFDRVSREVLEHARARGRAVHKACELDDAGTLDEATVDPRIAPYVEAWRKFRRESSFRVLEAETPLYHPACGYAGTPDLVIVYEDSRTAVIDRKSGFPGDAAALQTAAYADLVACKYAVPYNEVDRLALRMMPDGKYRVHPYNDPNDWPDFYACLRVLRLRERLAG